MLTKAILTGGVLSVLAGSIVYFGTEGADASENTAVDTMRVEETELAGAPDIAVTEQTDATAGWGETDKAQTSKAEDILVAEADNQDPPSDRSKPKTKWLDQYLKKTKSQKASDETGNAASEVDAESVEMPKDIGVSQDPDIPSEEVAPEGGLSKNVIIEIFDRKTSEGDGPESETAELMPEDQMRMEMPEDKNGARGEAKGTYIVSNENRFETLDIEDLDIDAFDLYAKELDGETDVDVDTILEDLDLDSKENVEIRVIKKMKGKMSRPVIAMNAETQIDYDMVLDEAKKLLVTDMRNQAFLEIVDYAIDQNDVMQAADIVDELSTPELRDTARARIGVGLARRGDTKAAFAVLNALEIDELSAPIRLEIITALMATKQERKNFGPQR